MSGANLTGESVEQSIGRSEASRNAFKRATELGGDTEKINELYGQWAQSYDADVGQEDYVGPRSIADLAVRFLGEQFSSGTWQDCRVVDAGCGTGLVGVELKRRGFSDISGFDINSEMVEQARLTDCYRKLAGAVDLHESLTEQFGEDNFDVAVSCGVFTLGHVAPAAMRRLLEITRAGGIVVVSARREYCEQTQFDEYCQTLQDERAADLVHEQYAQYVGDLEALYVVLRKR